MAPAVKGGKPKKTKVGKKQSSSSPPIGKTGTGKMAKRSKGSTR